MKKFIFLSILFLSLFVFVGCNRKVTEDEQSNPNHEGQKQSGVSLQNSDQNHQYNSGNYDFSLQIDGLTRKYLLHVPQNYDKNKKTPLVLAFHGGMGTAEIMEANYGLVPKSDKEGFIVAFPNGTSRLSSDKLATWNAGNCCGYAQDNNINDVDFVKAIISDLESKFNIGKIFATGMSNGGMLSYRLACEMSDTFTAIAAVAGTNNFEGCDPKQPISIMHIHGLKDD
ncbi:MAG: PHB depolymerase family esterase, partial [Candidatus Magasanikbacteria bacterium]|nr:PHB depolymerase family esterase [Candidatus Magasanikbacteria bacterium]